MLERTSMLRLELAYLYPADIRRLLAAAGFRDVIIKGGFDGRDFSRDGEELVVEATCVEFQLAALLRPYQPDRDVESSCQLPFAH